MYSHYIKWTHSLLIRHGRDLKVDPNSKPKFCHNFSIYFWDSNSVSARSFIKVSFVQTKLTIDKFYAVCVTQWGLSFPKKWSFLLTCFSKCEQVQRKVKIYSHIPKKFLMENCFFVCHIFLNSTTLTDDSLNLSDYNTFRKFHPSIAKKPCLYVLQEFTFLWNIRR